MNNNNIFVLLLLSILIALVSSSSDGKSFWAKQQRAPSRAAIEFRVALRQNNLDTLEDALIDVSTPSSPNYGKHWTSEEILDLIAPSQEDTNRVVQLLQENGAFNIENHRDYLKASASVEDVERLFRVEMYSFTHLEKNDEIIRASDMYAIPRGYSALIDIVSGISELPHYKARPTARRLGVDVGEDADPGIVIPQTIQSLYGIPTGYANNANSSLCLAEFTNDASYNANDLTTFSKQTSTPLIDVDHVVGPYDGSYPDSESTLDVQYGGAVASAGASIWFWTVRGWMYEFATDLYAANPAPFVVSMSWGWPENTQCQPGVADCNYEETSLHYITRVNVEYIKLGLRGISLIAASGDQGAAGANNAECYSDTPFSSIFPGASPYVTSVGATMLTAPSASDISNVGANPPICTANPCATSTSQVVASFPQALITSGGGFSDYFQRPAWQNDVVNAYFKSGVNLPDSDYYNASNRGFPDVSAIGHNLGCILSGKVNPVDGTSASTPIFAGIIAMLNSYRFNNGKSPLGFLNPMLYSAPSTAFTDITEGNNFCTEACCNLGYIAAKGWDPITGLGTPQFAQLLAYVKTLN
eukprot:gene5256-6083_t